jgi:hypothetical protein
MHTLKRRKSGLKQKSYCVHFLHTSRDYRYFEVVASTRDGSHETPCGYGEQQLPAISLPVLAAISDPDPSSRVPEMR